MPEKILLVDDEPNVLRACERLLHGRFETDATVGGAEALNAVKTHGPYAVVVSDLRMPQMDGIQLLTSVKNLAPDTVRIMLTGYADVQTALAAVNEGNIFRFLTKPCSKQTLVTALTAGLTQYRLVTSEKDILEKTLTGCLAALTEVLSTASPAAFSRAMRLRRYMRHIVQKLALPNQWKFEMAAMLSQLGCLTLTPETIEAACAGQPLSEKEQTLYDSHPKIAWDLLKNIPRMGGIAAMIAHQNRSETLEGDLGDAEFAETRLGAQLLEAALAFDARIRRGSSRSEAAAAVARLDDDLDPRVAVALVEVEPDPHEKQMHTCRIEEIVPGMFVEEDVRTEAGLLIVAKNQEVTPSVLLKLKNYYEKSAIIGDIVCSTIGKPLEKKAAARK